MILDLNQNFKNTYMKLTGIEINSVLEEKIKEISNYAQKIGLKFSTENNTEQIEYSNNICYLSQNSNEFSLVEFMIHNLSHYMIANPSRREMADFGLGASPDTNNLDVERYTSALVSELEERSSIRLSHYLFDYFKINNDQTLEQKEYYLKYNLTQALINMNILDQDHNLTHQLRQNEQDDETIYLAK